VLNHRAKGWKPDPKEDPSKPDPKFSVIRHSMKLLRGRTEPPSYVIPNPIAPYDQLQISSCTGNAWMGAIRLRLYLEQIEAPEPSRLYAYYNARVQDGEESSDNGSYLRSAGTAIKTLGIASEVLWPYRESAVNARPPIEAYKDGNDNRFVDGFFKIDTEDFARLDDVETAIRADHPVVFGTLVGDAFESFTGGQTPLNPPSHALGGHALYTYGVRRKADGKRDFLIRNSWGTGWGVHGDVWFSEEYMMWSDTQDLWVVTTVPRLV